MADSDDPKRTWGLWVRQWLAVKGWTQTDLVNASGGELNLKTINKWYNCAASASSDMAAITASLFGASLVEALTAAGHTRVASELTRLLEAEGKTPTADVAEGVRLILAADLLTDEEKADFIKGYRKDLEQADRRAADLVRAVQNARRTAAG